MDTRVTGMMESLPEPLDFKLCQKAISAAVYALKATRLTDWNEKRVFIQEYAAALNRRQILPNDQVEKFMQDLEDECGYEDGSLCILPNNYYLFLGEFIWIKNKLKRGT